MLISFLTMLVLTGTPPLSVDEAFEILRTNPRRVTEAQMVEAQKTIDRACPEGDEAWIRRLMGTGPDVWEGRKGAPGGFYLQLACKKANDQTLPIILDAVRREVDRLKKEGRDVDGLALFPSDMRASADMYLCERLENPEPLFQFALEMGGSVMRYRGLSAVKDKYLLEYISRQIDEGKKGGSYARHLSDAAIAPLRELMREMYQANPRSDGAWIGIETLTELSDTEIIPDLEAILASPPFDGKTWEFSTGPRLRMHLAKLKYQHSPADMIRIVETERDWGPVLSWATRRLLWLKTDPETIREALGKNHRLSERGRGKGMDLAEGALYHLFGEGPDFVIHPKHGKVSRYRFGFEFQLDPWIFDRGEFRQYHRDLAAMGEKSRELDEEEQAIRLAARLAPDFDYEEQRKNPGKWKREHPDEVRRLAEIAAAKKALWRDTMGKYTLGASLVRGPAGRDEARSN